MQKDNSKHSILSYRQFIIELCDVIIQLISV